MTITFSYMTPKFAATGFAMKALSQVARDWQLGAVLRYQSGALLGNPSSLNSLTSQLGRGAFGGNLWNLTGQPQFLITDPNCGCFNPQTDHGPEYGGVDDAPAGQWTTSAPYYNNFRWQRQPAESMSFARNFRVGKEGKYVLQIRGEFFNIFNRLFLSAPSLANPNVAITTTTYAGQAINNTGFGSIATLNGGGWWSSAAQRSGCCSVYVLRASLGTGLPAGPGMRSGRGGI